MVIFFIFNIVYALNLFWYKIIMNGLCKLIAGDVTGGADDDIGDGDNHQKKSKI